MADIYWPFNPSIINEGFGWSDWRQGIHDGLDINCAQGTPLPATASGIVIIYSSLKDGNGVDIKTADGIFVRHWHLSKFNVLNGQYIEAGTIIGLTGGAPGTFGAGHSTGPHLHWGTKVNGAWVDPQTLNPKHFGDKPKTQQIEEDEMTFVVTMVATGQSYLWNTRTAAWQEIPAADQLEVLKRGFKEWKFNDWEQFSNIKKWYEGTIVG